LAASILYNPREQFTLDDGTICAGGTLYFYAPESTTPKNVYSDVDLGVSLGATVELDSAGRTPTDVFLSGSYNVELKDADDVQVWLAENVNSLAEGGLIPLDPADGDDGQVYSTDGTTAEWRDVLEVPATTGHSNTVLKCIDDETYGWMPEQTLPTYDDDDLPASFTQDNAAQGSFTIGNIRVMWGADTGPSTGTLKSTKSVTFDVAFSGAPYVIAIGVASASSTGEGAGVSAQYTSPSASGFTANFFAGAEDNGGVAEINSTIPFTYVAIGPK
jgi:hypothetical protein